MPHPSLHMSRRGFLAVAAGTAVGIGASRRAGAERATSAPASRPSLPESSVVDMVSSDRVLNGRRVRDHRLREILERAVMNHAGEVSIKAAWRRYVTPGQRVLLKLSDLLGKGLGTEEAMVAALVKSMTGAGLRRADILVADPGWASLETGLAPVPPGWSEKTVRLGDGEDELRRYLDGVDAIINVPSLTDHSLVGLSCAMVNVSLPLIRHPGRHRGPKLHEAIVSLCESPQIMPRVKLTIVNVLRGLCDGAPIVREDFVAQGNSVWVGTDMVAVDRLALEWLQRRRRAKRMAELAREGRPATFIELAGRRGLGHADLRRIRPRRQLL